MYVSGQLGPMIFSFTDSPPFDLMMRYLDWVQLHLQDFFLLGFLPNIVRSSRDNPLPFLCFVIPFHLTSYNHLQGDQPLSRQRSNLRSIWRSRWRHQTCFGSKKNSSFHNHLFLPATSAEKKKLFDTNTLFLERLFLVNFQCDIFGRSGLGQFGGVIVTHQKYVLVSKAWKKTRGKGTPIDPSMFTSS